MIAQNATVANLELYLFNNFQLLYLIKMIIAKIQDLVFVYMVIGIIIRIFVKHVISLVNHVLELQLLVLFATEIEFGVYNYNAFVRDIIMKLEKKIA